MSPPARLDLMTTRARRTHSPRWALAFLAAAGAVLVAVFGAAPASAATAPGAQTRVGTSTSAGQVVVGASASVVAGQRLGNDPPQAGIVVATGVAANTAPRLAQDTVASPVAPRPLPLNRPVGGSATQNAFAQERIAGLQGRGATDFRVNQQQVNINGVRVGVNRPDLQYTMNGQRYYEEFDIPSSMRGPAHEARILSNDPSGVVNPFTVP